jgi:deoxyribonuclease-4
MASLNLGAHMSIAGGLHLACERGREVGCDVIQMFVKNERQWKARPLEDADAAGFKAARKAHRIATAFAHDTYLINMASPDAALWKKSVDAFVDELERCEALGLEFLVTHPGSPGEAGEEAGIRNMIRGLDAAHRRTKGFRTRVLLETTAGQGATVGWRFEQLKAILGGLKDSDRAGVCLDTCHVFAAGYDLSTREGYERTMDEFDRHLGLRALEAFHVNDSKKGLGCRVDRHENIGKGAIGLEAFRCLMRDARFRGVPKVLETPKENGMDSVNLRLLRELAG